MRIITKGATSKSIYVVILDSTSTTGARKTGLAYNTSSLTAYYVLNGGSATAITLATLAAANSAYSSGGFKEVDATNMPGVYRLDVPNAALTGADSVVITLKGATGMVQVDEEIQLTGVDLMDATRGGMTALPNANAEAAGGLYTRGSGAGQINQSANGQVDTNLARILNTAVSTPATAGVLDVNVKNMNNVAATSITTINANQGTTQPVNFTGTAGSALVKSDMVDVAGAAVSATSAQIGVNVVQINAQTASAAAGVTFPASIASPTNITAGTITTVTNLTNAPTAGDFTATMKTSLNAATPTVAAVTAAVTLSAGDSPVLQSGTAAAGAASTITIASAIGADSRPVGCIIKITSGTGSGQARGITGYVDATKVVTVDRPWTTTPDNTSVYSILYAEAAKLDSNLKIQGVVLADTITTYTGNTVQTGDSYARLGAPAGASVSADIAAAKVDTAAIKTKTDQLVFTVANQVDSNALSGAGGLNAAQIRAAIGLASANLDTQLAATAQDSTVAKDATVAKASAIAALNNISTAQVRTEARGAIADYGGIL